MSDTKFHTIDPAVAAAWCTKLAEPDLHQVAGHLCSFTNSYTGKQVGYCCLGVFALVQGATFKKEIVQDENGHDCEGSEMQGLVAGIGNINESELLLPDWANQFGITHDQQSFLSTLNDGTNQWVKAADPMLPLYKKYAVEVFSETTNGFGMPGYQMHFRKHTFAEISKIISDEFVAIEG